jgi:hypothetical protein
VVQLNTAYRKGLKMREEAIFLCALTVLAGRMHANPNTAA